MIKFPYKDWIKTFRYDERYGILYINGDVPFRMSKEEFKKWAGKTKYENKK